jgi:methyl-accepting chemotaxis protein
MGWLKQLGVRQKLTLLITVVLLAFLGSHAVQVRTLAEYRVGGRTYQELRQIEEAHDILQGLLAELSASRALLHLLLAPSSEDHVRQLQRRWEESAAGIEVHLRRAEEAGSQQSTRLLLADARVRWAEYALAIREQAFMAPPDSRLHALRAFLDGAQTRRLARLMELLEAETNTLRLSSAGLESDVHASLQRTQLWGVGAAGALFVLLSTFLLLLSRSIHRPLGRLVSAARQVEGGDLSVQFDTSADGELGQLSRSLGQMVRHLRELLLSMREAGAQLSQAVERMATTAEAQAKSSGLQASALKQTQETAHDIRRMSGDAARLAAEVLVGAERADAVGRAGGDALGASLQGIEDIRGQMEEIALRVMELGQKSVQVAAITESVKSLADQSNMLAINAAIEATRAGEVGKGFGVVARQMRELADRSVSATVEVRKKLNETSMAVGSTVSITEQGQARVEAGLAQVRSSGERLQELTRMLQDSSQGVRRIASAVESQHRGLASIFSAVEDLSHTTGQALEGVEAARKSAAELQQVTARLTNGLAGFRL